MWPTDDSEPITLDADPDDAHEDPPRQGAPDTAGMQDNDIDW